MINQCKRKLVTSPTPSTSCRRLLWALSSRRSLASASRGFCRLVLGPSDDGDFTNAVQLFQFVRIGRNVVRRNLAQENRKIIGPLLIPVFDQETLDLTVSQAKGFFQQFGRQASAIDLDLELAALISRSVGFFKRLDAGQDDQDDHG